jgi:hypothetical protein
MKRLLSIFVLIVSYTAYAENIIQDVFPFENEKGRGFGIIMDNKINFYVYNESNNNIERIFVEFVLPPEYQAVYIQYDKLIVVKDGEITSYKFNDGWLETDTQSFRTLNTNNGMSTIFNYQKVFQIHNRFLALISNGKLIFWRDLFFSQSNFTVPYGCQDIFMVGEGEFIGLLLDDRLVFYKRDNDSNFKEVKEYEFILPKNYQKVFIMQTNVLGLPYRYSDFGSIIVTIGVYVDNKIRFYSNQSYYLTLPVGSWPVEPDVSWYEIEDGMISLPANVQKIFVLQDNVTHENLLEWGQSNYIVAVLHDKLLFYQAGNNSWQIVNELKL